MCSGGRKVLRRAPEDWDFRASFRQHRSTVVGGKVNSMIIEVPDLSSAFGGIASGS